MKLVHLTTSGELGGAETSLVALIQSVREAEPNWDLAVLAPAEGSLVEHLRALRVPVRVLPFPPSLARFGERPAAFSVLTASTAGMSAAAYAWRLGAALRRDRPDVVHAHGFKMHVLSAVAPVRRAALVWHVHGYVSRRSWSARALRTLSPRVSAVIANSSSVAQDVQQTLGRRTLVRTMYNAVDLQRFSPGGDRLDLDAAAGLPAASPDTVRVGLVGTFGRWKGHHVFLDALARIPPVVPIRGYIVGGPIYQTRGSQLTEEELRRAVKDRRLDGRIGLTGFLPDVASAMRALDVVVHASIEPEPFGMVIAEAMACGRALVASRAGGAAELFDDGIDAFGHTPGNAEELAGVIQMLAVDPVLRQRAGCAARRRAEARFDRRRLAEQLIPLYRTFGPAA